MASYFVIKFRLQPQVKRWPPYDFAAQGGLILTLSSGLVLSGITYFAFPSLFWTPLELYCVRLDQLRLRNIWAVPEELCHPRGYSTDRDQASFEAVPNNASNAYSKPGLLNFQGFRAPTLPQDTSFSVCQPFLHQGLCLTCLPYPYLGFQYGTNLCLHYPRCNINARII